jgi:hemerythrin-like domain-containing protein
MSAGEVAATDSTTSESARQQGGSARAAALGRELIEIHEWLRESLARLRDDLDSPGSRLGTGTYARSIRAHCAGFCSALARHHTSEDQAAFPLLAAQVPELATVLAELQRDHRVVAEILPRVEALAGDFSPDNAQDVRSELDGLAAILESHFRWEERRIVDALNSLGSSSLNPERLFGLAVPPG